MKIWKYILIGISIGVFFFVGMRLYEVTRPITYPFMQAHENVEKVEICENDDVTRKRHVLVLLSREEAQQILQDITALKCQYYYRTPPLDTYGDVVILITYHNGEKEIIGSEGVGWMSSNGEEKYTAYFFEILDVLKLIEHYGYA